jgi:hypothetical protein
MKKSILMNLALDQLLDPKKNLEKIFSVRIPDSERLVRLTEDLGVFLSEPGDQVYQFKDVPVFLRELFAKRGARFGEVRPVRANPFDFQDWLQETKPFWRALDEHWVCGISPLEAAWQEAGFSLHEFNRQRLLNFRQFNRKSWLVQMAQMNEWPFPKTQLVETKSLLGRLPDRAILLKADWASGGGGNILVEGPSSALFRHLQTRLPDLDPDFVWLMQEKMERKKDWGVVARTDSSHFQVYEIQYDRYGLSNRHLLIEDPATLEKFAPWVETLRQQLSQVQYQGPFGFDAFETQAGQFFPVIDLNVRWTKTHLLEKIRERLQVPAEARMIRLRFRGEGVTEVDGFLSQIFQQLQLDARGETKSGEMWLPLVASGLEGFGVQGMEISYWNLGSSEWDQSVRSAILTAVKGSVAL